MSRHRVARRPVLSELERRVWVTALCSLGAAVMIVGVSLSAIEFVLWVVATP